MKRIGFLISFLFLFISYHAYAVEQVEFKKEIASLDIVSPPDVAVDDEGRIYTANIDKKTIQVLDWDSRQIAFWGGETKTEGWMLSKPSGIEIYKDKVYVTDSGTDSVFIFSKDGKYIDSFGEGGSGPKEFSNPAGICIASGAVYVADPGNRRIQIFSPDGIYLGFIGGKDVLERPVDVAVDYKGYIYVADSENVKVFTASGRLEATYHSVGKPVAIAIDKSGFYVADGSSYQVKKFDFKGNLILSFGTEGREKGQFRRISGIDIDPAGNIYVSDSKKGTVQIFSAKRNLMSDEDVPDMTSVQYVKDIPMVADRLLWDSKGNLYGVSRKENIIFILADSIIKKTFKTEKKGGWKNPGGINLDAEGFLWLADTGNDRILKLDENGMILQSIGSSGSKSGYLSEPADIDISGQGVLYVADTGNRVVQTFNSKDGVFLNVIGKIKDEPMFEKPVALALDSSNNIYVVDEASSRVFIFDPKGVPIMSFGAEGEGVGQFKEPTDIFVSATEIFVIDSGNHRIQVFDRNGRFLRQFGAEGKGKGDFLKPTSIAMKGITQVFVSDTDGKRIQLFNILTTPKTPINLKAGGGMRSITLSWDKSPEECVEKYVIYRSDDRIDFKEIAVVNTPSFVDETIKPEINYFYRVGAVATGGNESAKSPAVSAMAIKYIPTSVSWFSTSPGERDITITWQASPEPFVTEYAIYKEEAGSFKLLEKTAKTQYMDKKVKPETTYIYRLTAVSSDGVESDAAVIKVTTLKQTKPPVEIEIGQMQSVFANNYKSYETQPIGTIKLTNNTWEDIAQLKVSFVIKEFMDFPTEREIKDLRPGGFFGVPINAVFNNKILDLTENASIQAEIKVSYYEGNEPQVYTRNYPITIYERHHLVWTDREQIATFVTPKDPLVLEFVREVARQYSDLSPDPLIYARAVFDAFSIIGVSYIQDPNNPYQVSSESADQVDYVQYPRETLNRKSGDCDDLVNLYASALESLGVQTSLLDMPGHIFMMFSTGLEYSTVENDILKDMFIKHEGKAWIPVEVTLVGGSFIDAWKRGAAVYSEWKNKGLVVVDLRKAWETYKPATLPHLLWSAEKVKRDDIEAKFGDEIPYLTGIRVKLKSKKYLDALYEDPSDVDALLQLGIIYSENDWDTAADFFKKILTLKSQSSEAINNLANIYYLKGKYTEAIELYEEATAIDPNDPHLWVNIARCYLKLNKNIKAKEAFEMAYKLNPNIPRIYRNLAVQLADPSMIILDSP